MTGAFDTTYLSGLTTVSGDQHADEHMYLKSLLQIVDYITGKGAYAVLDREFLFIRLAGSIHRSSAHNYMAYDGEPISSTSA
jgi:hypothetical protein